MAEILCDFQCEFDVNELDDSLRPERYSSEGLFILYDVTSRFENYINDPSGDCLSFQGFSVEYSSLFHPIRHLDELHGSPDAASRDFFNKKHIPLGVLTEIRNQVGRKTISWIIDYNNAGLKVLLYHVKISTWASRYIPDDQDQAHGQDDGIAYVVVQDDVEDDLEEDMEDDLEYDVEDDVDMARVVTTSMEGENPRARIPAARSSVESLRKATYECSKFVLKTCRVCLDEFKEGKEVILMPCEHIYHGHCIVKWLEESNLCPLCRCSMPVDCLINDD